MKVLGATANERVVQGLVSEVCEATLYSKKFVSNTQVLPSVNRWQDQSIQYSEARFVRSLWVCSY